MTKLYEYAVTYTPTQRQIEEGQEPQVLVKPKTVLAKNEQIAYALAARAISEEDWKKCSAGNINFIVRPFTSLTEQQVQGQSLPRTTFSLQQPIQRDQYQEFLNRMSQQPEIRNTAFTNSVVPAVATESMQSNGSSPVNFNPSYSTQDVVETPTPH